MTRMGISMQGMAPDKLEVMTARVVDLISNDVVPESPIDTLSAFRGEGTVLQGGGETPCSNCD